MTDTTSFLQWSPLQHASHYEVEIGTDENFSAGGGNFLTQCQLAGVTLTAGLRVHVADGHAAVLARPAA